MDYFLFQFEQDKYYPLRRFPMVMRLKLDLCGIKMSISDWAKFSRPDREALAAMPYETQEQLDACRLRMKELIAAIDGESTETDPVARPAPWEITTVMPESVGRHIASLGIAPPTLAQWAALSNLQRYALVKQTREGAKNEKLPAILKEFGLVPVDDAS